MNSTIVIAGGGTGGHLYPALAVCEELRKIDPNSRIVFVGTRKGLEVEIVPKFGYELLFIEVGVLKGAGLFSKLKTLFGIPGAIFQASSILKQLKPRVVLGVGGYASGPTMLAAFFNGVPTFLFEANTFPGLTNRLLARFVKKAFLAFDEARKFFSVKRTEVVGLPVRSNLKPAARETSDRLRVLIFGGSQGALGVNNTVIKAVENAVEQKHAWLSKVQLIHQTGRVHYKNLLERYQKLRLSNVEVLEFIHDMDKKYAWADLVICRSGASTLQELACCRKAAILVPFPFASDDHQKKNAQAYAQKEASILVEQKDFSQEKFVSILEEFLRDRSKIYEMENNVAHFFVPQSAQRTAQLLMENSK